MHKYHQSTILHEQLVHVFQNSDKDIVLYSPVAGGVHNGEYVSWLYCYDPIMDVWARKQDMNTKRAIHALAGMNDRLYAIGGNHLKGKCLSISGKEILALSLEYAVYAVYQRFDIF